MFDRLRHRDARPPLEPVLFSPGLTAEVARLLDGDDGRVAAVRLVRERTGLSLLLAVRAVDHQAGESA